MQRATIREGAIRMDHDFSQMTTLELISTRSRLEDDLADLEETAAFHSANSPSHVTTAERQRESDRQQRIKDEIAEIDLLLTQQTQK